MNIRAFVGSNIKEIFIGYSDVTVYSIKIQQQHQTENYKIKSLGFIVWLFQN